MLIKATMGYYFKNLCFDTLKTLIKSLCCGGFVYIVWYLCASSETMVTASRGLRILDLGFVNVWCLGNMSDEHGTDPRSKKRENNNNNTFRATINNT